MAEMEEEKHAWDQMVDEGENNLWYGRFVQFLRLGSGRSIRSVFLGESKQKRAKASTNVSQVWCDAAKRFNWTERARAYDEYVRAEEDRIIAEEKEKVLRSGYALMHKRIQELDELSCKLIEYASDETKVWIPETRTITTGEESVQVVEKVVFNAPLFQLIEKYFAGIAAEMGERVKKKDITVTELPPNVYLNFDPNKDGSES